MPKGVGPKRDLAVSLATRLTAEVGLRGQVEQRLTIASRRHLDLYSVVKLLVDSFCRTRCTGAWPPPRSPETVTERTGARDARRAAGPLFDRRPRGEAQFEHPESAARLADFLG